MAGEIKEANERYRARRAAAGMDDNGQNGYDEMAVVWSGLDLDITEMRAMKIAIGMGALQNLIAGADPLQVASSVYLDGIVIGLLIAEARERERREPNAEELDMIALALKNQGIEQVAPERGVEILIERLSTVAR